MSQEGLARAANLSNRAVQTYLKPDGSVPGGAVAMILARILGVQVEDWFEVHVEEERA